ncbi:polysaccharide lyase family 3 protein [Aaosphaeria arxii CBS 175.79]|uniref:Probable pectate lyase F n=1 Tax=Aaosphaeria arxii CBS 175.79 TaxID=1450172 RepID=A0A6A5Y2T4_9PLEO|nr:polysaccharide lyase family 3 protein [Aaosphaeria arxii CBS 175.79]KAF2019865.1 polysaccharide lyase family 3 protein [Aaosphaeria arxii CBS 175.79]
MRFSYSTIATLALVLTAEAAPPFGRPREHKGNRPELPGSRPLPPWLPSGMPTGGAPFPNPTGGLPSRFPTDAAPFPGPTGLPPQQPGLPGTGAPGLPIPPSGLPQPPSGLPVPPSGAPEAPALAPTGAPGDAVSSIEFEFPSSIAVAQRAKATDEETKEATATSTLAKSTGNTKAPTGFSTVASVATSAVPSGDASSVSSVVASTDASAAPSSAPSSVPSTPPSTGGGKASSTFPEAAGESTLAEPMSVTGEFDGGMTRFGRGVTCGGQSEGGDSDAVFLLEDGATLKNVIIGADQSEGVHCLGSCTIENVWWEAVCEDALTLKQDSGTSKVIGGGAKGASDKVVQHNGGGTVAISNFYVSDFGKLYRSCGNCKTMFERHVTLDGVLAEGGTSTAVGINTNFGDTATITNSCIKAKEICTEFEGNDTGAEPKKISSGPSSSCIFTDADVNAC